MNRVAVPPPRSPVWIALSASLGGVATYVMLVVVGRVLGAEEYGSFSVFWSAVLIVSFGLFLPVEQIVARRQAGRPASFDLFAAATRLGAGLAAASVVLIVVIVTAGPSAASLSAATLIAFALAAAGFAVQFPARGLLAGTHRMSGYASVITLDSMARLAAIVVLATAGVASVGPYAASIGLSALLAGLVGLVLCRRGDSQQPGPVAGLARETSGLSLAMLCMQVLVNSPMLIAGFVCADPLAAGHLLALTTTARLAVFVAQSGQAVYVGRIAAATFRGDEIGRRRLITGVGLVVTGLATATTAGMALLGPALITLIYGDGFQVDRAECVLVGAGIATYLIATVANDVAVALERHQRAGTTWLVGLGLASIPALLMDDTILRSTIPLLVGTAAAAVVTLTRLRGGRSSRMKV